MSSCCDSLQLGNIEPNMVAKTLAKWKQHNGNDTINGEIIKHKSQAKGSKKGWIKTKSGPKNLNKWVV